MCDGGSLDAVLNPVPELRVRGVVNGGMRRDANGIEEEVLSM